MALLRSFTRKNMERNSLHEEIDATYTIFDRDGRIILQIDSYGSADRQIPRKEEAKHPTRQGWSRGSL
jgi:hypothetical protein